MPILLSLVAHFYGFVYNLIMIFKQKILKLQNLIKANICLILLVLLCGYLAFCGLGNNYFWDDEATVAFYSKNLLNYGELTGWDGRNLWTYRNGALLNNDLVDTFDSPMQHLVTVLSFSLLGISTISARIPFVIFGILSLIIFYAMLKEFKLDKNTILTALTIYSLSPSFLLYIRQARYYSLANFFVLCSFYYYTKLISSKKPLYAIWFTLSAILLFYAHYLIAIIFISTLFVYYLIYNNSKKYTKILLPALLFFAIFTIPYLLYNKIPFKFKNIMPEVHHRSWLYDKITLFLWHLREINNFNWLPWIIIIGLFYFTFFNNKNNLYNKITAKISVFTILAVFFTSLYSIQPVAVTKIADVRYISFLLPFFAILTAVFLSILRHKSIILFIILFPTIIFTNLLSINPFNPNIRFDLINYISEIHNDYTTPYEAVDFFLQKHAKQDDYVFIYPTYNNYPIIFYTGNKVKLCGMINKNTSLPIEKIKKLDKNFFKEESHPDWIIMFGIHDVSEELINYFSRKNHHYELYDTLDIYWQDMTRPEIPLHSFGPVKDFDPNCEGIYIYKRAN